MMIEIEIFHNIRKCIDVEEIEEYFGKYKAKEAIIGTLIMCNEN
jgi:hypothetical protein